VLELRIRVLQEFLSILKATKELSFSLFSSFVEELDMSPAYFVRFYGTLTNGGFAIDNPNDIRLVTDALQKYLFIIAVQISVIATQRVDSSFP